MTGTLFQSIEITRVHLEARQLAWVQHYTCSGSASTQQINEFNLDGSACASRLCDPWYSNNQWDVGRQLSICFLTPFI